MTPKNMSNKLSLTLCLTKAGSWVTTLKDAQIKEWKQYLRKKNKWKCQRYITNFRTSRWLKPQMWALIRAATRTKTPKRTLTTPCWGSEARSGRPSLCALIRTDSISLRACAGAAIRLRVANLGRLPTVLTRISKNTRLASAKNATINSIRRRPKT